MNFLRRLFGQKRQASAPTLSPFPEVENKRRVDVKPADTDSVQFVKTEYRAAGGNEQYTYQVYRAETRAQAEEFLKEQVVRQKLYYLEVETPDGTFGRDIEGMYEV